MDTHLQFNILFYSIILRCLLRKAWTHPKIPPPYDLEWVCEGAGCGVAGLGRGVGVPVAAADPGDERGHLQIYTGCPTILAPLCFLTFSRALEHIQRNF